MVMRSKSPKSLGLVTTTSFTKKGAVSVTSSTDIASDLHLIVSGSVNGNFTSPNPWSWSYRRSTRNNGVSRRISSSGNGSEIRGPQNTGAIPSYADIAMAGPYNAALSRLADMVRGGLDLSVNAFQLKQNARMMNAVGRIRNFKIPGGPAGLIGAAGSAWLEFQYGWKPVMEDVYGVAEESLRFVMNNSRVFTASALDRDKFAVESKSGPPASTVRDLVSRETKVRVSVRCSTVPGFDLQRYTSLNPISIAWELLPYSFVVDWFVNVGGYLRCAETALLNGNRFQSGYFTVLSHKTVDHVEYSSGKDAYGNDVYRDISGSHQWGSMNRTPLTSYPFPRLPRISADLGSRRLLNAASLLSQRLK